MRCKEHPTSSISPDIGDLCIPFMRCEVCRMYIYSEIGKETLINSKSLRSFARKDQTIEQHLVHLEKVIRV